MMVCKLYESLYLVAKEAKEEFICDTIVLHFLPYVRKPDSLGKAVGVAIVANHL